VSQFRLRITQVIQQIQYGHLFIKLSVGGYGTDNLASDKVKILVAFAL
jgi:hypothetical protein